MEAQPRVDEFNNRARNENNLAFALPMPSRETMATYQRVEEFNNWATNFNNNAFALGQPQQRAPPQSSWVPPERRLNAPTSDKVVPPVTGSIDMNSTIAGITNILTVLNGCLKIFNVKILGQKTEQDAKQFFEHTIKMDISKERVNEMKNASLGRTNVQALKDLGIHADTISNDLLNARLNTRNSYDDDNNGWSDYDFAVKSIPTQPVQELNTPSIPEPKGIFNRPSKTVANPNYNPNGNINKNERKWSGALHAEDYGINDKNIVEKLRRQAKLSSITGTINVAVGTSNRIGGGANINGNDLLFYLFNLYDLFILEDNFNLFIKKNVIDKNSKNVLNFLYILNIYDYIKKLRNTFIILNDLKSYKNLNNYLKRLNDEFCVLFNSFSGGNIIKSNKKKQTTIKKNKIKNKKTLRKTRNNKKTLKKMFKKLKKTKKLKK
jgi:hypothetical protein